MSNEEIKALAEIFALCYKATNSKNDADLGNAMVFPFQYATQYVRKLHMCRTICPRVSHSRNKAFGCRSSTASNLRMSSKIFVAYACNLLQSVIYSK